MGGIISTYLENTTRARGIHGWSIFDTRGLGRLGVDKAREVWAGTLIGNLGIPCKDQHKRLTYDM